MNYEHWRHYARGWLFHFFDREDSAFEAFSQAFRIDPKDVKSARTSPRLPPTSSVSMSPTSGSWWRWN
jgi:hypothetical protein